MPSDWTLLEEIKHRIAKEANLDEVAVWSQKDFDFLSYFIEEKTGCRLSVSTLKRIWSNTYQRLPHISTLDALSKTAFDKNWQILKSDSITNQIAKKGSSFKSTLIKRKKMLTQIMIGLVLMVPIALILIAGAKAVQKRAGAKEEMPDVAFSHRKTVENKLPNTVVFTYNVEEIKADRFFLQQSWDTSRKVQISKETTERTDIYYIPGYFTAKLIADDQIIKEMPVHVIYEDWFIAARQPMSNIITFDKPLWSRKDYLGIGKKNLAIKGVDVNKEFQLAYYHVKDFEVSGDNLHYKTSFKMEPLENVDCPIINIHLQGTQGYYWLMLGNKGCGSELAVRVGETLHNGKAQDLTQLTTNMYQWNEFEIHTMDKHVRLELNGITVFSTSFQNSIGGIMELSFFFNGIGMVDNVELKNEQGEIKFFDDFKSLNAQAP